MMRKAHGLLAAITATLIVAFQPAKADQLITATVEASGLPTGITARGMVAVTRTSDIGAEYIYCEIQGSNSSCTASDSNTATPKNIGNVVCIPKNFNSPVLTTTCSDMINDGQGECQTNSAAGSCNPNLEHEIKPVCNYRTEKDSGTSASWTWQITAPASQSTAFTLNCEKSGYQGYTQN